MSFCDKALDTKPIDDLGEALRHTTRVGLGLLALTALLLLILCALREWWSWRCLHKHVENTRDAYLLSLSGRGQSTKQISMLDTPSLFALMQLSTHPLMAKVGLTIARRLGIKGSQSLAYLRWWLAWISHPIAVAVIAMGLVGLLTVEAQLRAVAVVKGQFQHRFDGMLDGTANGLQADIDAYFGDASREFANKSNTVIIDAQNGLNDGLFRWVNVT